MAKFIYTALKDNKNIVKGEVEAESLREARIKIRELGFLPTKVYTEFSDEQIETFEKKSQSVKFLSLSDKILFTSELETLISAGIPILQALQSIELNSSSEKLKEISLNVRESITAGKTFAQSLSDLYLHLFGPIYTGLLKTGENSGELEVVLARLLTMLRKQEAIKGRIIQASIYPCVLIVIMFGLLLLFSKFVFPIFMGVISFNGGCVPCMARMLINICNFFNNYWWMLILTGAASTKAVMELFKNPAVKSKWDDFVLKIPVVRDFVRYINLSNFMTVLHISYEAGVPIMSGLELSNKIVGNTVIKKQVSDSVKIVKNGKTLTEAFRNTQLVPGPLMSMISTGEMSGNLGKMLADTADVIDKKVDMALEALTRLFEPTVIVIMGAIVLFIAVAFWQMYAGMLLSL